MPLAVALLLALEEPRYIPVADVTVQVYVLPPDWAQVWGLGGIRVCKYDGLPVRNGRLYGYYSQDFVRTRDGYEEAD